MSDLEDILNALHGTVTSEAEHVTYRRGKPKRTKPNELLLSCPRSSAGVYDITTLTPRADRADSFSDEMAARIRRVNEATFASPYWTNPGRWGG